jgi:hypothetical protein
MNDKLVRLSDVERWLLTESACIDTPADRDAVVERMRCSIPAVDAVPMDFHDRCMQIEIKKRHDLERFAKWVMDEIFSENWEDNRIAFDELACRKLVKMGYVAVDEENDLYYRKDEPEDG